MSIEEGATQEQPALDSAKILVNAQTDQTGDHLAPVASFNMGTSFSAITAPHRSSPRLPTVNRRQSPSLASLGLVSEMACKILRSVLSEYGVYALSCFNPQECTCIAYHVDVLRAYTRRPVEQGLWPIQTFAKHKATVQHQWEQNEQLVRTRNYGPVSSTTVPKLGKWAG